MTIQLHTKTVLHCKCVKCDYEWDTFTKPARCARCRRHSWNGEDGRAVRYQKKPAAKPAPPPQVRVKPVLEALAGSREIIEQIIHDFGPCDHDKKVCVCDETNALQKVTRQIEVLRHFQ